MVGKGFAKKEGMRAYIKARYKIGFFKQLLTEISVVYRSINVSHDTFRRWKKKFDFG